ncbi:MAG: argininosuccinate lyase [Fibrobacterota bacterium]|nr:argininosuccinate lyase [Fibrobacterota bacterium]QQS03633.1 MAG: argininosuccinate lyase [Fibrobacterota bacterium]
MTTTQSALWAGRFDAGMSEALRAISFSLHFDQKLLAYDVRGSQAHARSLGRLGVLSEAEVLSIVEGLEGILADIVAGADLYLPSDEDVHMAVERILTDRIGSAGRKLHTGRSRNDQVATAFRLYVRDQARKAHAGLVALQETVLSIAVEHRATIMAGYTHMQQAQPVTLGHYLLSLFFALERDRRRFCEARDRAGKNPLGSGALAGSAFPVDRHKVALELGFSGVTENSIDAVSHRDWVLEYLGACAILGTTLSRYAEDFVTWSAAEFGYVTFSDQYTTGSSMMPNKKNPDGFELARGKSGRLVGNLTSLMVATKGAPLTYSRDLQEDKEPVFDSAQTVEVLLGIFRGALQDATWHPDRMLARLTDLLLATDLADLLVEAGIPFRDAHHVVGTLVGEATRAGKGMLQLPDASWQAVPDGLSLRAKLSFAASLDRRNIEGGTGPVSVERQLAQAAEYLAQGIQLQTELDRGGF